MRVLLALLFSLIASSAWAGIIQAPGPVPTTCAGGQFFSAYSQYGVPPTCGAGVATGTINTGGPQAIGVYNTSGTTISPGTLASYFTLSGSALGISDLPNAQLAHSSVILGGTTINLGDTVTALTGPLTIPNLTVTGSFTATGLVTATDLAGGASLANIGAGNITSTYLANSGATAGTYTCPTMNVNVAGIVTSIANGTCSSGPGGGILVTNIAGNTLGTNAAGNTLGTQ